MKNEILIASMAGLLSFNNAENRGIGGGFSKSLRKRPKDEPTKKRRKANKVAAKSRVKNRK